MRRAEHLSRKQYISMIVGMMIVIAAYVAVTAHYLV